MNTQSKIISIKNLILIFLTIIFGSMSVITLGGLTIPSDINNAHQTIGRITITNNGTEDGTVYRDIDGKTSKTTMNISGNSIVGFTGKLLGINSSGELIYSKTTDIVIASKGIPGSIQFSDKNILSGNNYLIRSGGNVGIGTSNPTSGKLHITNSGSTEIFIEENTPGMAANINLKNTARIRGIGADSNPDIFYIGNYFLTITPNGNVGIGTTGPMAKFEVNGRGKITNGIQIKGTELGTCDNTNEGTMMYRYTKPSSVLQICMKIRNEGVQNYVYSRENIYIKTGSGIDPN